MSMSEKTDVFEMDALTPSGMILMTGSVRLDLDGQKAVVPIKATVIVYVNETRAVWGDN